MTLRPVATRRRRVERHTPAHRVRVEPASVRTVQRDRIPRGSKEVIGAIVGTGVVTRITVVATRGAHCGATRATQSGASLRWEGASPAAG